MNNACSYDGPAPSFIKERDRTAIKFHKCGECGEKILPLMIYREIVGVWDGDFYRMKQCACCARIMDDLKDMGFCPCYGELWEYIGEEFEQPSEQE